MAARRASAAGIRLRRIGVLLGLSAKDREEQLRIKAFKSAWPELGWIEGRNIHVDYSRAPTRRSNDDAVCCGAWIRCWHVGEIPGCQLFARFRG